MIDVLSEIVHDPWPFLIQTLLAEFLVVVIGVIIAQLILNNWVRYRYGNWRVVVARGNDKPLVDREVSPAKAKMVLSETADLSVFLKGIVSPYEHLNCDLIDKGQKIDLLVVDRKAKRFVIDLDNNPDKKGEGNADVHVELGVL